MGWSLVFSEDDFTVRQFNLATANCNQSDTRLAMHWHALAKVMPILDIRRTIVSITEEQVLYTGWSLVFSEDEICATASDRLQSRATPWHSPESIWSFFCQFKPIQYQSGANLMPVQGQLCIPTSIKQISKKRSVGANSSKSHANPSQSIANSMPLLRTFVPST